MKTSADFPAERFNDELESIRRVLLKGQEPGGIVSAVSTGDQHLHGEAVSKITTSEGFTLYYKPRDCKSTDLLGDLTQLLFKERMVPEQITGKGYAFQKEVCRKLPETPEEKTGYYKRLGLITALFYALGSTDMHNGNIICAGGHPVVIDTETLLCARADEVAGAGEFSVDYGDVFPDYQTSAGESMVLPRFYGYRQSSPLVLPEGLHPGGYEQVFISGFEDGYRMICAEKEGVIRLLKLYEDMPLRYLLRSTQYYAVRILLYNNAEDDLQKEEVLNVLNKGLSEADLRRWAPVLEWERSCIREGDIPYFWLTAAGRDLMGDMNAAALIPGYLERSPVEYAVWRMERMCEKDLKVQTAYINASLRHIDDWDLIRAERKPETCNKSEMVPASVQEVICEVEETVTKLWEERIPLSDGGCLWHTPMIKGKVGSMFGLAEGFSGTAVFVHACAGSALITEEAAKKAQIMCRACFLTLASFGEYLIRKYPQPPDERIISRRFNGGFDLKEGLAGYLWALKQCADEDPERTERILEGFSAWNIPDAGDDHAVLKQLLTGNAPEGETGTGSADAAYILNETDCLENGNAQRAAALMLDSRAGRALKERFDEAGIILKQMTERKKERGCYQIFGRGRHSYFLPAFLCGNTGIAFTMLYYAGSMNKE